MIAPIGAYSFTPTAGLGSPCLVLLGTTKLSGTDEYCVRHRLPVTREFLLRNRCLIARDGSNQGPNLFRLEASLMAVLTKDIPGFGGLYRSLKNGDVIGTSNFGWFGGSQGLQSRGSVARKQSSPALTASFSSRGFSGRNLRCHVSNLAWCSARENVLHTIHAGKHSRLLSPEDVISIRERYKAGETMEALS